MLWPLRKNNGSNTVILKVRYFLKDVYLDHGYKSKTYYFKHVFFKIPSNYGK